MSENERKLTLWAKIFLILTCASLIIGNALSLLVYSGAKEEVQGFSPEDEDPIAAMAFLGVMLIQVIGCILYAGVGNLLSILFSSFSISFSSKAARACTHTPPCRAARYLKPISIALLIISIIALILTLPVSFILSFFILA